MTDYLASRLDGLHLLASAQTSLQRLAASVRLAKWRSLVPALVVLFISGLPLTSSAQTPLEPRGAQSADGVTGLVVNQTVTTGGYDFYLLFTEVWRTRPDSENHVLSIVERPSTRYGNQVSVFLGQTRVYSGVLPRKYEQLRPLCEQAVETILANIVAMLLDTPTSGQTDLGKTEL
jgi:curli production assembly/transport component CsgE